MYARASMPVAVQILRGQHLLLERGACKGKSMSRDTPMKFDSVSAACLRLRA